MISILIQITVYLKLIIWEEVHLAKSVSQKHSIWRKSNYFESINSEHN